MLKPFAKILAEDDTQSIRAALASALERSDESPFWAQKVLPLADAVLSVLVPLRDRGLLFDPEGNPVAELTPELVLRWCDLLSLKTLAFILQESNQAGALQRTKYDASAAESYRPVELKTLAEYLGSYTVNLEDEWQDFPIAHYNLHVGIAGVLEKLMR